MGAVADLADDGMGAEAAAWELHAAHSASTAHDAARIDLVLIDVTDSLFGLLVGGH